MTKDDDAGIHATCVLLARAGAAFGAPRDAGILLLGPSGAGKSDLALRLIAAGAKLVSDDRTILSARRGRLWARAPKTLEGLIELRGVGIVALPRAARACVTLAVALDGAKGRLPAREHYDPPKGLSGRVPLLRLAPFEASAPAKIALAVAAFERNLFRETVRRK